MTSGNTTYFSNHSQRFTPSQSSQSLTTISTNAHAHTPANQPRLRSVSSKHFSTTVHDAKAESETAIVHPLRHTWILWFQHRAPGSKNANYEEGIKKVAAFSSVESFWSLWTHLNPPSSLQPTTDYLLFHQGVRRPIWEDPLNVNGGKWIIRLKKGIADRLWEELVLGVVGDHFAHGSDTDGVTLGPDEICGCTISVRSNEDIIAVWNKSGAEERVRIKIRDIIRKVLSLNSQTTMEYKSNNG